MDQEVLTEVPDSMKRLIRYVARGFYSVEHALVVDMLVRNPCMKEDDMLELLKFDKKQLRAVINTLKSEKFIKARIRVETDSEGRTTRHNFYFINYLMFVNVVKYKLDHVRRKIEMEERDNTSRASFKCEECQKTFTDLEADQLFDFMAQVFRCTICQNEVQEEVSSLPQQDARTLLAKFNDQIQPLYDLLRECEDVKLAPELMEPEPTDMNKSRARTTGRPDKDGERTMWSGDTTRNVNFGYTETSVTISTNPEDKKEKEAPREQPIWMKESTVEGVPMEDMDRNNQDIVSGSKESGPRPEVNREIEALLMIHEKKTSGTIPLTGSADAEDSDSSDSEAESSRPSRPAIQTHDVEDMQSDGEEEDIVMVSVAGSKVPLSDVTDEMVASMSLEEKSEYIKLGQEMYKDMYE